MLGANASGHMTHSRLAGMLGMGSNLLLPSCRFESALVVPPGSTPLHLTLPVPDVAQDGLGGKVCAGLMMAWYFEHALACNFDPVIRVGASS
eukprot:1158076-Pelagomonas_calceolata.AAC.13